MRILRFNEKLFSGFNEFYRINRNKIQIKNSQDAISGKCDDQIKDRAEKLYEDWYYAQQNYTKDAFIQASLEAIHAGETFALGVYVKNDKKQNSAEECQIEFIKDKLGKLFTSITSLKKLGKRAIYCTDAGNIGNTRGSTKSLDLEMVYKFSGKTLTFYGTLKHIDNKGGAQDNQFNDLIATNKVFAKVNDPNIATITVVSGSYFTPTKMNELSKYSGVSKIDDIEKLVPKIIVNWLNTNFPDAQAEIERVKKYEK